MPKLVSVYLEQSMAPPTEPSVADRAVSDVPSRGSWLCRAAPVIAAVRAQCCCQSVAAVTAAVSYDSIRSREWTCCAGFPIGLQLTADRRCRCVVVAVLCSEAVTHVRDDLLRWYL